MGKFPSWKETQSHTWRHDETKADANSDGRPNPVTEFENVGAHLPYPLPQE